jgi:hypothetical protein
MLLGGSAEGAREHEGAYAVGGGVRDEMQALRRQPLARAMLGLCGHMIRGST